MDTGTKSSLRVVGERLATEQEELEHQAAPAPQAQAEAAGVTLDVILLALKVLGQRAATIAGHAYPVLALGAAFFMWWQVMATPTPYQLVGLGLFAAFLLCMQILRRK